MPKSATKRPTGRATSQPHLPTSTLADLYLNHRLTLKQVGAKVGMHHSSVVKRLQAAGIRRRSQYGRDYAPRPAQR
jgi:hypothetical protein